MFLPVRSSLPTGHRSAYHLRSDPRGRYPPPNLVLRPQHKVQIFLEVCCPPQTIFPCSSVRTSSRPPGTRLWGPRTDRPLPTTGTTEDVFPGPRRGPKSYEIRSGRRLHRNPRGRSGRRTPFLVEGRLSRTPLELCRVLSRPRVGRRETVRTRSHPPLRQFPSEGTPFPSRLLMGSSASSWYSFQRRGPPKPENLGNRIPGTIVGS